MIISVQHTAHSTQHTAHSTKHTAHSTQHTAHSTQHTAHCTQHTAHSTQHTAHSTQHTAHSTQHTAHSTQHTAHSTQHTAHTETHNFHYSTESSKTKFRTNIGSKPHYETWYSRDCDDNFRRLSWTDDGLTCLSNNCQSCSVSVAFPMAQLLQYYKYVAYQVIFSIVHFCRFPALLS
jgi:hypothetical protein